jgi:hypothetical protein
MTKDPIYHTRGENPGTSLKTGFLRITIDETTANVDIGNTKVKSLPMTLTNLNDSIEIDFPFSEPVDDGMTLSCVYATGAGDLISQTGITTNCTSSSCKCFTTHLTDFILEEHTDISSVNATVDSTPEQILMLGVHKSFAFWISLFLILALAPLIILVIIKDKQDIERYGLKGNPFLKKYAIF